MLIEANVAEREGLLGCNPTSTVDRMGWVQEGRVIGVAVLRQLFIIGNGFDEGKTTILHPVFRFCPAVGKGPTIIVDCHDLVAFLRQSY